MIPPVGSLSIRGVMIFAVISRVLTSSSSISNFCGTKNSITKVISSSIMGDCKQHSEDNLRALARKLVPPLTLEKYKGQAGRIAVFGGSTEYTGAPYFAAITALKVGADLSHVFCTKDAASVIKSYSPELIVHPLLTVENPLAEIEPWIERFHTILIGPGLGRDQKIFDVIGDVIKLCNKYKKPLVIDADGLFYVTQNPEILTNYSASIVLTPNKMEFSRLTATPVDSTVPSQERAKKILDQSPNLYILLKGKDDEIFNKNQKILVTGGGSGRRCGGQGDLMSGSLATFLHWSQINDDTLDVDKVLLAAWASSRLVRLCNEKAFREAGRSMTASDMIGKIHDVFEETFEN